MRREGTPKPWLQAAAMARIDELAARRPGAATTPAPRADEGDDAFKAAVRGSWALGDYGAFATALVWDLGDVVARAAGARPGLRILDVAAGTGNTAIRAAQAGADVVASDLTPENFEAGRALAREAGVELEWVEADAEQLPFADASFDAVTSSVGAIFAPRHQRVADELLRVCKPGGTIAMANFSPDGLAADFFGVFAPYMPPPRPGDLPPVLWGDPEHVRGLFGDRVAELTFEPRTYVERAETPAAYCEFFKRTFGPVVGIYRALADQPDQLRALDRAFLAFAQKANTGPAGGPAELVYPYQLVVARKR